MTQSRDTAEATTFAEAFEASLNFKTPEQGELLRGQIVSISGDDAFVSYGVPSEAVMAAAELDGLEVGGIVVSRAALLKETAAQKAQETRKAIAVGAELEGTIKTITPFGAFVDLGGVDGLLHVSEMSRRRVTDPKEVVQLGQQVRVKVIKLENDGKRISLSMKDQEPDPWGDVGDRYPVGAQFSGTIVRTTDFGLFVEVEPGIDGLVHYSQLPLGVKQGDDSIAIGTTVTGW